MQYVLGRRYIFGDVLESFRARVLLLTPPLLHLRSCLVQHVGAADRRLRGPWQLASGAQNAPLPARAPPKPQVCTGLLQAAPDNAEARMSASTRRPGNAPAHWASRTKVPAVTPTWVETLVPRQCALQARNAAFTQGSCPLHPFPSEPSGLLILGGEKV